MASFQSPVQTWVGPAVDFLGVLKVLWQIRQRFLPKLPPKSLWDSRQFPQLLLETLQPSVLQNSVRASRRFRRLLLKRLQQDLRQTQAKRPLHLPLTRFRESLHQLGSNGIYVDGHFHFFLYQPCFLFLRPDC